MKQPHDDWRQGGFGLYLHWPFCESKCPYCDFNSHVARTVDQARWAAAYGVEIDRVGALAQDRVLDTVFFGGGTPSLMAPETVAAILERIRATWPLSNSLETTLEANPGSVEAGRFAAYRAAGINRISMGIQSLRDDHLRALGRLHSAAEARAAFSIARDLFPRVSFDLIYARQAQDAATWRVELREALAMAADHLSLYQLTIEPGTAFGDRFRRGGLAGLPDEELAADLFEITQDITEAAGMPAYEVSNHARDGAESRHNRIYWTGGDYVGIGPGAHGRLTLGGVRHATEALRQPEAWLQAVEKRHRMETVTRLSGTEQALEYLLMGLRLTEGVRLDRLQSMAGRRLGPGAIAELVESGHVVAEGARLRTTRAGRLLLNPVIRRLAEGWGLSG